MPLKIAVFREEFTYQEENIPNDINKEKNKKYGHKNRKRKIIWFNPPFFCRLASINVGKYFFNWQISTLNMIIYYIKYLIEKR